MATITNGAAVYSLNDGLGSVREETTQAGGVSGTSDFDAFGLSLHQTGSLSPIGFTGGLTDPETGFVYLRARYYDPSTGRFQTRDPLPGLKTDPASQNGSSYAHDNPTRYIDPRGVDDGVTDPGGCGPDSNDCNGSTNGTTNAGLGSNTPPPAPLPPPGDPPADPPVAVAPGGSGTVSSANPCQGPCGPAPQNGQDPCELITINADGTGTERACPEAPTPVTRTIENLTSFLIHDQRSQCAVSVAALIAGAFFADVPADAEELSQVLQFLAKAQSSLSSVPGAFSAVAVVQSCTPT